MATLESLEGQLNTIDENLDQTLVNLGTPEDTSISNDIANLKDIVNTINDRLDSFDRSSSPIAYTPTGATFPSVGDIIYERSKRTVNPNDPNIAALISQAAIDYSIRLFENDQQAMNTAIALLVLHWNSQPTSGTTGSIIQEKEGDLEIRRQVNYSSKDDDDLCTTIYGQALNRLKKSFRLSFFNRMSYAQNYI